MKRVVPTPFPSDPFLDNPVILGSTIRSARTQAGIRLEDAAMTIGVSLQTLVDIEAGKPGVSIGKILQVANGLGVSLFVIPQNQREIARRRLIDLITEQVT